MMEGYFKNTKCWRPCSRISIYLAFGLLYVVIAIYGYIKMADISNIAAILSVIVYSLAFLFLMIFLKKWFNIRSEMEKEVVAARQLKTHPDHQDVYQPKTQTAEARNQAACVIL